MSIAGRLPTQPALVPAEWPEHGCAGRRYLGESCGAGAPGTHFGEAFEDSRRCRHCEPEVFPRDPWQDCGRACGHFADRAYRRSGGIEILGSVESSYCCGESNGDALVEKGKQLDLHAAGMLALDVARVEAGLLLIEVDYSSSKKALIPSEKYSPYELGFAKMVTSGEKRTCIGKRALERDAKNGSAAATCRRGSGLDRCGRAL